MNVPRRVTAWFKRAPIRRTLVSLTLAVAVILGAGWGFVTWKLRVARKALQDGDFNRAIAALESAERVYPRNAELLFHLGRAYRRADRIELARDYLQRAERRGWPQDEIKQQRSLLQVQLGLSGPAEAYIRGLLRGNVPDQLAEEIYEARAKGYMKTYRLADAYLCLKYWIEWKPRMVQPRLWMAEIWERMDDPKRAVDEYRAVLQLDADNAVALRGLADKMLTQNRVAEARDHFERARATDPDNSETLIGLAKCERRLANAEAARKLLEHVLNRELTREQRMGVLVEMADMELRDMRNPGKSVELLLQADKVLPLNDKVHAALSVAYRRLGRAKLADSHAAKAKEIRDRFERLTNITKQLVKTPSDLKLRMEAGRIFIKQGMPLEGARWIATVLLIDPSHREANLALAKYWEQQGDAKSAERHRKRAAAGRRKR